MVYKNLKNNQIQLKIMRFKYLPDLCLLLKGRRCSNMAVENVFETWFCMLSSTVQGMTYFWAPQASLWIKMAFFGPFSRAHYSKFTIQFNMIRNLTLFNVATNISLKSSKISFHFMPNFPSKPTFENWLHTKSAPWCSLAIWTSWTSWASKLEC